MQVSEEIAWAEFYSNDHPLQFVTTKRREQPNNFNTEPLQSINSGRGSVVYFNPGQTFVPLYTGFDSLEEGKRSGLSGHCVDFQREVGPGFPLVINQDFPC